MCSETRRKQASCTWWFALCRLYGRLLVSLWQPWVRLLDQIPPDSAALGLCADVLSRLWEGFASERLVRLVNFWDSPKRLSTFARSKHTIRATTDLHRARLSLLRERINLSLVRFPGVAGGSRAIHPIGFYPWERSPCDPAICLPVSVPVKLSMGRCHHLKPPAGIW